MKNSTPILPILLLLITIILLLATVRCSDDTKRSVTFGDNIAMDDTCANDIWLRDLRPGDRILVRYAIDYSAVEIEHNDIVQRVIFGKMQNMFDQDLWSEWVATYDEIEDDDWLFDSRYPKQKTMR